MELMRCVVPTAKLLAILINPTGPNLAGVSRDLDAEARGLGQQTLVVHASTEAELDAVFATLAAKADALAIGTDTFFNSQSARLVRLGLAHGPPAMYR